MGRRPESSSDREGGCGENGSGVMNDSVRKMVEKVITGWINGTILLTRISKAVPQPRTRISACLPQRPHYPQTIAFFTR